MLSVHVLCRKITPDCDVCRMYNNKDINKLKVSFTDWIQNKFGNQCTDRMRAKIEHLLSTSNGWKDAISENLTKVIFEQYKSKRIKVFTFTNLRQLEIFITFSEIEENFTFPLCLTADAVFHLNKHILNCNTNINITDLKRSEKCFEYIYTNSTPESDLVKNAEYLQACNGLQSHHLITDTDTSLKNEIDCVNKTQIIDCVGCDSSVCPGLQKINHEIDNRNISDLQRCDTRLYMESRSYQQWRTFNPNLLVELTTKFLFMYFFFSFIGSKCFPIQPISAQHCEISNISMKIVESCPLNLESWKQRSKLKNCSSLYKHSTCTWPENYVYHCVIDHFMSVKIEMCAVEAFINLGYCAEYNTKGELIQANYEAKCHHCPERYLSSKAYKYQECYNMTQKPPMTTMEQLRTSEDMTTSLTTNGTTQQNESEGNSLIVTGVVVWTIFAVLIWSGLTIITKMCYPKYKEYRSKKKLYLSTQMTFPMPLTKTSSALMEKCAKEKSTKNLPLKDSAEPLIQMI